MGFFKSISDHILLGLWYQIVMWMNLAHFRVSHGVKKTYIDWDLSRYSEGFVWSLLAICYYISTEITLTEFLKKHHYFGMVFDRRTIAHLDAILFKYIPKYSWIYLLGYVVVYGWGLLVHLCDLYHLTMEGIRAGMFEWNFYLIVGYYSLLLMWFMEVISKVLTPILRYVFHHQCGVPVVQRVVIISDKHRLLIHINMNDGRIFAERMDIYSNVFLEGSLYRRRFVQPPAPTDLRTGAGDGWWND